MKFQPGNKAAPGGHRPNAGRKPDALKDELHRLMDTAAPLSARKAIVKKMAERANEGSVKHAEFIFGYAYGKPAQVLQVEGPAGGPLLIEYVNDWRESPAGEVPGPFPSPDPAPLPPPGAADCKAAGE